MAEDRVTRRLVVTLAAAGVVAACGANAEPRTTDETLGRSLGSVEFPVGCDTGATATIERGVAALHHMMYANARELFQEAAASDPRCAIALWGVAMTYIHPLWPDRPTPEILKIGAELSDKTIAISGTSDRENAYLQTVKAYFEGDEARSEKQRLARFEAAWRRVYETNPEDLEAKAFFALAHMATADPGDKSYAKQERAGALTQEILAAVPDHPGGHHYTIHAYDSAALAERALPVARNYGKIAPDAAHALHMPTHIFTRMGLWAESIEWNRRSAAAAWKLSEALGAISMHYLHALDYLAYAYLQKGQDEAALKVVRDAASLAPPYHELARDPAAFALAAIPARYALERHAWAEAAELRPRVPRTFPWEDTHAKYVAMTHFARSLGLAHEGRLKEASAEVTKLEAIRDQVSGFSVYWAEQVEIQRLAAAAWVRYLNGDVADGVSMMKRAALLEATTEKSPVTPGTILPASELYGDMLLLQERHQEALEAYEVSLTRGPRRFNSLYGAGRAAQRMGDSDRAYRFFAELARISAGGDDSRPALSQAREFLE